MFIKKILLISLLFIFLFYLFFFIIFPFFAAGVLSLYEINNKDTKNHNIVIKIIDSNNKTILLKSYNIQPDTTIKYDREFGCYPTITLTPFTWSEGRYTFIAVLDNNYIASHTTNVQITQTIWIQIKQHDSEPLEISEMWV